MTCLYEFSHGDKPRVYVALQVNSFVSTREMHETRMCVITCISVSKFVGSEAPMHLSTALLIIIIIRTLHLISAVHTFNVII